MRFLQGLNIGFNILIIVGLVLPPSFAFAGRRGGSDTGGGGVVFCGDPTKGDRIETDKDGRTYFVRGNFSLVLKHGRKYQLLDLFMAEHGLGPFEDNPLPFRAPDQTLSKEKYLERALNRIRAVHPLLAAGIEKYLPVVQARTKPIREESYIPFPMDARVLSLPNGCVGLGLGIFDDRKNTLHFDPVIRKELPNMDLAAFDFHEATYKYFREAFKHTTSWDAQRIVGYAFSEYDFKVEDLIDDMDELKD